MDGKTLKTLEYDKVLERVSLHAVSEKAKSDILCLKPTFDYKKAVILQDTTQQAIIAKNKYLINPVYGLDDILPLIEKAEIGLTLSPSDFLKIAKVLNAASSAKRSVMNCGDDVSLIKDFVSFLIPDMTLTKKIGETVAGEDEVRDGASDLLRTIRRKIAALNNKLKEKLNAYTHSPQHGKYLQDGIITVREGRFVLPVKSEYRANIPGLIHDKSASGSTVYVEPFPIVELNNELKAMKLSERDEVERILKSLTADVEAGKTGLITDYEQLIALDVVFAKAAYAFETKATKPILNTCGKTEIKECRHPLIAPERVIPIDISFGEEKNILVITGPNTGGKTVSLKTMGLFSLMAYSGLQLPCAEGGHLPVFDNIFCDLGDEQSIAQSLSTFSSHITNIAQITDSVTPHSLVLIDEIGAGTDPVEGAALAVGILKYLELINCKAVITTHYSELKEYALISPKLQNACMQFDEETLKPTYRLIIGMPGVSNALDIAKNLGINDYILKSAKTSLKEEKIQFERVLMNAEKVKSDAIEELENIRKIKIELTEKQKKADDTLAALNSKLAQINDNAKLETQKIVRKATEKASELIEEIKEKLEKADEAALLEAKKLQKRLDALNYEEGNESISASFVDLNREDIRIGTEILVKSLNQRGKIIALPNKKGLVGIASGSMNLMLPISDLAAVTQSVAKREPSKILGQPKKAGNDSTLAAAVTEEIFVLGMTVGEAIETIEPHIISASTCENKPVLRIVHGKGTGALGKGIQQYCRKHSLVKSFRYGRYGEGDVGVTFVEVK